MASIVVKLRNSSTRPKQNHLFIRINLFGPDFHFEAVSVRFGLTGTPDAVVEEGVALAALL